MNQDRVAVVVDGHNYSYADLDRASRSVAGALLGAGEDLQEARVAFLIPPGFEYAAVQRGIWRAGGIAVPLAVSHPPPELEYVIRDAGAAMVVGETASAGILRPIADAAGARFATAADMMTAEEPVALPHLGATRRAMIIYTS